MRWLNVPRRPFLIPFRFKSSWAASTTLMEKAREKGADDKVMNALNQLAEKRYNSANDVSEEIGKLT